MPRIATERQDNVLIILADSPPVNALGAEVRQGLAAALVEAEADDDVDAIVLACRGRTFFAGADIAEFGKQMAEPVLPVLADRIEAIGKPVVAAIHGTALGGGFEVALACHYRIAAPSTKLGLPEVKLGICPGAGGTQRLPRIAGTALALEMIAKGGPISASCAKEAGVVDRIADGDLLAAAIAFAAEVANARPLPRISERPAQEDMAAFEAFRKSNPRLFTGARAPGVIVDLLEKTAALRYSEGAALEGKAFVELLLGEESRAQRHAFFAERKAAKIDDISTDAVERPIHRVGVIGAGTMGGGIAMNFLSADMPVTIVEMAQEPLERGVATIRKNYEATAAKGRMTGEQVERAMALLTPSLTLDVLADCDLIIEAVYESMDIKKELFIKLDRIAKAGAVLASNTSFLDINDMAAVTNRREDVVGLHFFSPANVMKLLEVVRGTWTADDVLATAMGLARRIGKVPVVSGVCHGFIANRMLMPRQDEAVKLLMEGAMPHQIDKVHVDFGMPMGPFQMADLAGLDIGWHRDPTRIESLRDALAAEGRWGQKRKAGWYDYDEKRAPTPSPRVGMIISVFRAQNGAAQREITTQEIIERTLYPVVNEGARILEEGMAQRASDIDVVWIHGFGWPAWRGGPMFWADSVGLPKIVASLERNGFEVSQLLRAKAAAGESFT